MRKYETPQVQEKYSKIDLSKYSDVVDDEYLYAPVQGVQLKLMRWLCEEEMLTMEELEHVKTELTGDRICMELHSSDSDVTYILVYNMVLSNCHLRIVK